MAISLPKIKTVVSIMVLFASYLPIGTTWAANLPKSNSVPGGIIIVPLDVISNTPPKALFNGIRVMVIPDSNKADSWLAITGIALEEKAGKHHLKVMDNNGINKKISFVVHKKKYKTQYITLKNKRQVNPNKKDMQRITRDTKKIKKALKNRL